jgi:hypothetical protein
MAQADRHYEMCIDPQFRGPSHMRPGLGVIWHARVLAISNLPNLLITQPCILGPREVIQYINGSNGTLYSRDLHLPLSRHPLRLQRAQFTPSPQRDLNSDFIALSGRRALCGQSASNRFGHYRNTESYPGTLSPPGYDAFRSHLILNIPQPLK